MDSKNDATLEINSLREDLAVFRNRLEKLVRDEAVATRLNVERKWSKPIPIRVSEGFAIEGIEILGSDVGGEIRLGCAHNRSRFREGDILCLNRGDPFSQPKVKVRLEQDDNTELLVSSTDIGLPWSDLLEEHSGWMLDEDYLDLSYFFIDALKEVGDTSIGRERILPLLMGHTRPVIDSVRVERGLAHGEAADLDWSQSEALAHAYATDSVYLIQGPPGTGKTRVLAHIADILADEGERVFVTALTHRAINNALNMLAKVAPLAPAIKVGAARRSDDLDAENYETFDASPMASMDGGYIIGATPFAARMNRLSGVEFDTVIFDEASQITLPLAIMAMLSARKYIFIGDHKQLPPVLVSRPISESFRYSVFGDLIDRGIDTMLRETYRLNEELVEWPSRLFYDGQLQPADGVAERRIRYPRKPGKLMKILDPDKPKVFLDLCHRNTTTRSAREAGIIADLIRTLLDCGFPAREIGVVTPYRAQAMEIRSFLHQVVKERGCLQEIVVDTVERMQGQERDLIMVSLTTSNPAFALGLADFFFQPQRINVAITRPRVKLIIVGSSHLIAAEPEDPDLQASIELLKDLIQSCDYHVFGDGASY